ncbi:hypothetical protein ACFRAR_36950 [Kitasatospora sp. NPDC056651]|uniref:hypothetical protein n=1 Tax=Kitasatospora sp. NPDC056651 TaxID=3345892 RepID=UPI00369B2989
MTTAPTAPTTPVLPLPARHSGGCPFGPPPVYSEAAATGPVTRAELPDGDLCWLVTGFTEVRTVLSDRRFSADIRHPAFPLLVAGARELITDNPDFLRLDDPEHARQRRMLTGEFLVKRVESLRPEIQRIVDEALDRMTAGRTTADLVTDFALPVPSLVICLLLGVPYEDHNRFQRLSRTMLNQESTVEQLREAQEEVRDYLRDLTARKRGRTPDRPGDAVPPAAGAAAGRRARVPYRVVHLRDAVTARDLVSGAQRRTLSGVPGGAVRAVMCGAR